MTLIKSISELFLAVIVRTRRVPRNLVVSQ